MKKINYFLILFISLICFDYFKNNENINYNLSPSYSSKFDPEECYSVGRAFSDVGVFPEREFYGEGIKIGIIEHYLPDDLTSYNVGDFDVEIYNHSDTHCEKVASVLSGPSGVARDATLYFSCETATNTLSSCLHWLINVKQVDIICRSLGGTDSVSDGYYTKETSALIDNYLKNSGVIYVNANGNRTSDYVNISTAAMPINAISAGVSDKNCTLSDDYNVYGYCYDYDDIMEKPFIYAPGVDLYGFDTQNMSALDTNIKNQVFYTGTSFSAPIVSGIIALLLEEFPSLKGHPEAVRSILGSSWNGWIVDYQAARKAAHNYYTYNIANNAYNGQVLCQTNVFINLGETIDVDNFIKFNGVETSGHGAYYTPSELVFSNIKILIENWSGLVVSDTFTTSSNLRVSYSNNYYSNNSFTIKVVLFGSKASVGVEYASLSYRIYNHNDAFSFSHSSLYLDEPPSFSWSIDSSIYSGTVSLKFYNFRDQIVFTKNNRSLTDTVYLSLSEWHSLLGLRGKEFYAVLEIEDISGNISYSNYLIIEEPSSFSTISNINPVDFNYADAYNNSVSTNTMTVDGIGISIERLRCGYIQEQYINLSAKRLGAGHAYLQLVFNSTIPYLSFGVTQWKEYELESYDGDTAVVEVMDSNGVWSEYIDLLSDVTLPVSRKDIIRFNVFNIKGIRFDTTATHGTDRNKGRLCIDNISFTNDSLFTNYLSTFTEPIVVREDFSTH